MGITLNYPRHLRLATMAESTEAEVICSKMTQRVISDLERLTKPGLPPYLPLHKELVLLSGICEVLLGILLLVPPCSGLAAWGIIALKRCS